MLIFPPSLQVSRGGDNYPMKVPYPITVREQVTVNEEGKSF